MPLTALIHVCARTVLEQLCKSIGKGTALLLLLLSIDTPQPSATSVCCMHWYFGRYVGTTLSCLVSCSTLTTCLERRRSSRGRPRCCCPPSALMTSPSCFLALTPRPPRCSALTCKLSHCLIRQCQEQFAKGSALCWQTMRATALHWQLHVSANTC